ncbi:FecCD family ABC transporter permease [Paenibacillus planticolens]|uniref:Iron chelate uptake ABC transporter family permease subunit n=1 Tax=Paenibacillus planticolens TaxID=2654976 RepID=A0ABX1ZQJ9_9BACL|nr:iron ABC transporter permease [Paenibacillus planticolens]NOV01039.1 iron chelate uptake ABC transporter family permease subunit [Paenibacillus planticolens]
MSNNTAALLHTRKSKMVALTAGAACLLVLAIASVLMGEQTFGLDDLWASYRHFNGSNEHLILRTARVSRVLVAVAVGACLAVAGAVMQVLTRNPLASPSVFGINAGASLFIVIGLVLYGSALTMNMMIWIAFAGALFVSICVYAMAMRGSWFEPVKLTLAGAAMGAFASSITSGLILINKQSLDAALFWMIGSVSGRKLDHLLSVAPYMAIGLGLSLLLSGSLNIMMLGEESARSLGQRVTLVRLLSSLAVVLLAGSSVSAAGPIAFVGLIVPHLCRALIGQDHRWLLPCCALSGAVLLVAADLAARFVLMPKEVPVGIATAMLGVPFLIHAARRKAND